MIPKKGKMGGGIAMLIAKEFGSKKDKGGDAMSDQEKEDRKQDRLSRGMLDSEDEDMMSKDEDEESTDDPVDLFIEAMGGTPSAEARKAFKLAVRSCKDEYEEELEHMPTAVSQASLRSRIRTAVRQPNTNGFISDSEINEIITEGVYELYDLLIEARGSAYYITDVGFNTVAGTMEYSLPQRFYRLVSIMVCDVPGASGGTVRASSRHWVEIPRMNQADTAKLLNWDSGRHVDMQYILSGRQQEGLSLPIAQIRFLPIPTGAWNVWVSYLPTLDTSNDPITSAPLYDGINGWESYVVAHACAHIAAMQEESPAFWAAKKAEIKQRISKLAPGRDQARPAQVADRWVDNNSEFELWGPRWR